MSSSTNEITQNKFSWWTVLFRQFKNPLLLVFIIATIVSFYVGERTEAVVISLVMTISVLLGFFNEYQAEKVVQDLIKRISFTVNVVRDGVKQSILVKDIRVNDEIVLHPGSIVPADLKITFAENFELNESVLTGESLPVFKREGDKVYMGTVVTGGNAHGTVIAIGMDTRFGKISEMVGKIRPETEFQKGLKDFSSFLAKVAGVMVFLVIGVGWYLNHPLIDTILFALTIAIGITPELLPLIVSLSLSYGAKKLAKKDVIVKQFVSIEDLGNMEVLCTDKTGTLTEGKISLTSYTNLDGKSDYSLIRFGLICNSGFSHGHAATDSIDKAIIDFAAKNSIDAYSKPNKPEKLYEIPFDYENRFMAITIKDKDGITIICKGSPDAILPRTNLVGSEKEKAEKLTHDLQNKGFRVIAVASKRLKSFNPKLVRTELKDLKLDGLISFADVPKKDLKEAFDKFAKLGVAIKIITGDNELVAQKVASEAGFNYKKVLVSSQIEKINDEELSKIVWDTDIFARVTPSQKTRIIKTLKKSGHTVGFLGDGINDGPGLHMADVGISVNTGVDVAKDSASVVLLRKNLSIIAEGIKEGRITFNNTIKYILMGTSSDFGNMVSAAIASIFLPFLPMTPAQILTNNVLYDISQLSIPSDNVDADQILKPKNWDINYIKHFMILFGLIGTLYDFLTFIVMYFIFHARGSFFQTGWFVTSFIEQVLVVFVIRTQKVPFFKSRPGSIFAATCLSMVVIAMFLPFSPISGYFDFVRLPSLYFIFLLILSLTYLIIVEFCKIYLNKRTLAK